MGGKPIGTRDCRSCGKDFVPATKNQVYCPECRALGHKRALRNAHGLERAYRRNLAVYYDVDMEVRESACEVCGKAIRYTARKLKPAQAPKHCSRECASKARIAATKCATCGKPMPGSGDERDTMGKPWYCSDACRDAAAWKKAEATGEVRTCPECGKRFVGKKTTYCSKACYETRQARKRAEAAKSTRTCPECGKEFSGKQTTYCSKACYDACVKRKMEARKANPYPYAVRCAGCGSEIKLKYRPDPEKEYVCGRCAAERKTKAPSAKAMAMAKARKELDYVLRNGLCPICRVPYPDCERMSSNFRYSPEGASFQDGKVVRCPKFTMESLKYIGQEELDRIAADARADALAKRKGA